MRLADESLVGDLLRERDAGKLICTETERAPDLCVSMSEVGLGEGAIFPPVVWPAAADYLHRRLGSPRPRRRLHD